MRHSTVYQYAGWFGINYNNLNGVARTLKKLRTLKGDYWVNQWFSSMRPFSLKEKEFAPRGSEFFPLRTVSFGMENHFYHIRRPPLNVTTFITRVRNCVIGATPMNLLPMWECKNTMILTKSRKSTWEQFPIQPRDIICKVTFQNPLFDILVISPMQQSIWFAYTRVRVLRFVVYYTGLFKQNQNKSDVILFYEGRFLCS